MQKIVEGRFDAHVAERGEAQAKRTQSKGPTIQSKPKTETAPGRRSKVKPVPPPAPPFWGARQLSGVALEALVPYLNERMLYQFQWGYRKNGRSLEDYMAWAEKELRPVLKKVLAEAKDEGILEPQAVYGYWPAQGEGNDIILFDPQEREREVARFALPRQQRNGSLCIADFLAERASGDQDVIGLQIVTMGQGASDAARDWFAQDRYQDYLYLHGLGVELAEALAEYVHRRIRGELGFGGDDNRDLKKVLQQDYRGARYSFGYPACPNLEDQTQILKLLEAERIGVELSDAYQLHPEQSTSALVIHHPDARYFTI